MSLHGFYKGSMLSMGCFILDQASKLVALSWLPPQQPLSIPGPFQWKVTINTSHVVDWQTKLPTPWPQTFLTVQTILTLCLTGYGMLRTRGNTQAAFALILGGVCGNLFDRIFRPGVIDFLHTRIPFLSLWIVFNIADLLIVAGCCALLLQFAKTCIVSLEKS